MLSQTSSVWDQVDTQGITGKLRAAVKYKWVKSEFEKIRRSKMPTMTPRIIMDERRLQLHERLGALIDEKGR
jgi:hypothetical protein